MTEPDPAHAAAWRELRPLVDEAVTALPEKYRTLLLLCYFEGKSSDEAAQLLQLPSGTARSRLARGRDLLRQRLLRRGLTLATGTLAACLAGPAMGAPLPTRLFEPTVQAATSVAAGAAMPAGCVSAPAAALYRGELLAMFMNHLKSATALALAAGVTFGSTVFGLAARADKPAPVDPPAAVAAAEQAPAPKADAKAAAVASPFEGRWTAKLEFGGRSVMTRIEFVTEDGKLKGVARPSKDASYELQKPTVDGMKISFDVDTGNAEISIKGQLKDGGVSGSIEVLTKNEGLVEGTFTMTRPQ